MCRIKWEEFPAALAARLVIIIFIFLFLYYVYFTVFLSLLSLRVDFSRYVCLGGYMGIRGRRRKKIKNKINRQQTIMGDGRSCNSYRALERVLYTTLALVNDEREREREWKADGCVCIHIHTVGIGAKWKPMGESRRWPRWEEFERNLTNPTGIEGRATTYFIWLLNA